MKSNSHFIVRLYCFWFCWNVISNIVHWKLNTEQTVQTRKGFTIWTWTSFCWKKRRYSVCTINAFVYCLPCQLLRIALWFFCLLCAKFTDNRWTNNQRDCHQKRLNLSLLLLLSFVLDHWQRNVRLFEPKTSQVDFIFVRSLKKIM